MNIKGIKGRNNLLKVKASKLKYRCYLFTTRFLLEDNFRCTICITKKSGNAVKRNQIRRWFRSSFQEQYKINPFNISMFVFVIPGIINYHIVKSEVIKLFSHLQKY